MHIYISYLFLASLHCYPRYHLWAVIKPDQKQHEEGRANLFILLLHKMKGRVETQGSRQESKNRNGPGTMEECGLQACSAWFLIWPVTQEWCSTQDHSYSGGTSHSGLGSSTSILIQRFVHMTIRWRQFHNWGSLFPGDYSLFQTDINYSAQLYRVKIQRPDIVWQPGIVSKSWSLFSVDFICPIMNSNPSPYTNRPYS